MLARLARLPPRRCLHTPPRRPHIAPNANRIGLILGASAGAAILAWRLTADTHRIALDAPHPMATRKTGSVGDKSASAPAPELAPEPELEPEPKPHPEPKTEPEPESQSEPEAEAEGSSGAFNPVTGEINWDCPCLGGMAHGPCGPQFREAFSCFVYSEGEPKGIDCVEKFKAMQDCFREHPDVYGDEIMGDDDDDPEAEALNAPTGSVEGDTGKQTEETKPPMTSTTLKTATPEAPSSSDFEPTPTTPTPTA